jgi:hypothetical protein
MRTLRAPCQVVYQQSSGIKELTFQQESGGVFVGIVLSALVCFASSRSQGVRMCGIFTFFSLQKLYIQ